MRTTFLKHKALPCLLLFMGSCLAFGAQSHTQTLKTGGKLTSYYNHKAFHSVAALTLDFKNNNFFAGPSLTRHYMTPSSTIQITEKNKLVVGFNAGYRKLFTKDRARLSFFLQTEVFLYPLKHVSYTYDEEGCYVVHKHRKLILENTVAVGARYKAGERLAMSFGIGFGSNEYFFLMLRNAIPTLFLSLEW